ncbi:MAG TPA: septum site-determining protein MinC [Armatimonadota bacterium]|nr:septum site-determining protein MinC [Armatimonadota bacterium]
MSRTEAIRFKGTRQGVHLLIEPEVDLQEVLVELDQRLKSSDQFFRSAAVMLNVGDREMSESQLASLKEILLRYGLEIVSAQAAHTDTRSVLRSLGVDVSMPSESGGLLVAERPAPLPEGPGRPGSKAPPLAGEALVAHRNLRSGQSLHHSGDICLIGDVNPGAELVAGDNVIVWGSLRGVVHAGTRGNDQAVICALELAPTQLRIASLVTRQPEAMEMEPAPEMARIVDGQIVVKQWLPRSHRNRR